MSTNKVAIGIDLGTTNSCVGVVRNGRVEIIANEQGNRITPSYVAFTDSERLVGDAAKSQATMNPENTVYDIKRLIGRKYDDPDAQKNMDHWPFQVRNVEGNPQIQVTFKEETKLYSPEEISSMVLINMKKTAEVFMGGPVTDAVITVPAYFNDSQRQATIDAGKIAGLNVLSIINEPTAAAIAYGVDKKISDQRNILIYDLGGGTFDVVLLSIEGEEYEVKAVNGDTFLGGADFDHLLMNHFIAEFKKKYKIDLSENNRAKAKLKKACENAKRNLSSSVKERIQIESLHEGIDFDSSISRVRFEELCSKIFKGTMEPVEKVLRDANMDKNQIDEVVLAGGSTRIPKIQALLENFFQGKKLNKTINPDEAVAYGAAIHAAILAGESTVEEILLLDVCPLSLGIEIIGGHTSKIIKRNTKIPSEVHRKYQTTTDYQEAVDIKVYEGERSLSDHNNLLGAFTLEGIQREKKGMSKIDVTFHIDENGILTASARDVSTGKQKSITITSNKGRLKKEEIQRMMIEAKEDEEEDAKMQERTLARSDLETLCFNTKSQVEQKRNEEGIASDDFEDIYSACSQVILWLDEHQEASKEECNLKKTELEKLCERFSGFC